MTLASAAFSRFVAVGLLCSVLNLAIQFLGTSLLGLHYLLSVAISFVVVNAIGFRLNREFTFESRSPRIGEQAAIYYVLMAVSLAANLGLMIVLVDGLGLHYLVAATITTGLFVVLNFLGHRRITFRSLRQ